MTNVDYLIVGSGLTGGTIARLLTDAGREVLILERRAHLGGNVHDSVHASGIRVHTYGPHYFRCSSPKIWDFVQRFSSFYDYQAVVKSQVNGHFEVWPLNETMFDQFPGWRQSRPSGPPANFEEACLQKMPRPLYETFIRGYTRRQWGVDPRLLEPALASRIRINRKPEIHLTPHYAFQGLPTGGYAQLMLNLLQEIPTFGGVDYLEHRSDYRARKALIFTGSVDEFFNFDAGRLGYRSQKRNHEFLPGCSWHQPCAQVNHPTADDRAPVRTLEWKHLMQPKEQTAISGTVITQEFPFTPDSPEEFEYPMPTPHSAALYRQYRERAAAIPRLVVCGRLGAYRYFDMDQAIGHAMTVGKALLSRDAQPTEINAALLAASLDPATTAAGVSSRASN
jgi:UDP-galactopyranose mutase